MKDERRQLDTVHCSDQETINPRLPQNKLFD